MTDDHIGQTEGEFAVCQFFADESCEYVRRRVGGLEAVEAFRHYCTSVGARLGTTIRVILTDGEDFINAEWKWAEGVTYLGTATHHLGKFKEGRDE